MSGKLDDIFTYLIVTFNDDTSVAAAECVTHRKFLQATVAFLLKVGGVKVISST